MNAIVLARLRAQAETFLTDTCFIERPSNTITEYMTPDNQWLVIAAGVRCRMLLGNRQMVGVALVSAGQETLTDSYLLALPRDTNIQADDRVTHQEEVYSVVRLETQLTDEFFIHVVVKRKRGADNG